MSTAPDASVALAKEILDGQQRTGQSGTCLW